MVSLPRRSVFDPSSVRVMFVWYKVAVGQVSVRVRRSPCRYHSTGYSDSSVSTGCSYQDKGAKPGNLPNWGTLDVMSLTV